jgi:flagellar motor protein MotB
MKLAIPTAVLLLLLGTTASAYAQEKGQEEPKQEAKPAQQQAKPAQQQHAQQAKPAQQPRTQQAKPAQQHAQQQTKPAQQQHAQTKPAQQQHAQAKPAQQQRTQQVRAQQSQPAGGTHGRISDAHYASNFGSGHRFHVSQSDYQHRRFSYGGYSFGFVDPWPSDWAYTDDVYVLYVDNGYYMYNPAHPGVRISISIF